MYRNLNKNISAVTKEVNLLLQRNELLKNAWFETLLCADYELNKGLMLMSDTGSIAVKDIISKRTLIVQLSYPACRPCLERELRNIRKLERKDVPILIIANYPNKHSLNVLLKQYDISSKAYLLPPNQKVFASDENLPLLCVFIANHDLAIEKLFIPIQMEDDVSETYFRYVESLFLLND